MLSNQIGSPCVVTLERIKQTEKVKGKELTKSSQIIAGNERRRTA